MPSESVVGFLDHAQASRVLFPEQIEQLIRQPDIPHTDLSALCEYLLSRGVLTRFQATAIREARGPDLSFGTYPIIDEIGPCPGGTAYKVLHPSLRTPLMLRRIRADWFAPADNPTNFLGRARSFGMLAHPNLVPLLDAGFHNDEVYLVIDQPADAADLEALAHEVGAMPGFLAAEYGRTIASVLRMAHERGGVHGDVRPANLIVGPLTMKTGSDGRPRRRPAPEAVVRLAELGMVPVRPAAASDLSTMPNPYLPPERVDAGTYDPRGDIYGLGATLYFLLTGRPPFPGDDATDILNRVRSADPAPLSGLRPDLPDDLAALVTRMMAKDPERRPATAYDVETALIKFCRVGTVPPQAVIPTAAPVSMIAVAHPALELIAVEAEPEAEPGEAWGVGGDSFTHAHADAETAPRKRVISEKEKARYRMLFILGLLLHGTWIALALAWAFGAFDSPTPTEQETTSKATQKQEKKDDGPPKRKK